MSEKRAGRENSAAAAIAAAGARGLRRCQTATDLGGNLHGALLVSDEKKG